MDTSAAGVPTVKLVDPEIDPDVAVIVVVPAVTPVAKPVPLMLATAALPELQDTELVRFCVLPSV